MAEIETIRFTPESLKSLYHFSNLVRKVIDTEPVTDEMEIKVRNSSSSHGEAWCGRYYDLTYHRKSPSIRGFLGVVYYEEMEVYVGFENWDKSIITSSALRKGKEICGYWVDRNPEEIRILMNNDLVMRLLTVELPEQETMLRDLLRAGNKAMVESLPKEYFEETE